MLCMFNAAGVLDQRRAPGTTSDVPHPAGRWPGAGSIGSMARQ